MSFGQFAATTQFYLYGRRWCTRTGWLKSSSAYPQPDELESLDVSDRVYIITGANSGIGYECTSYLAKKNASVYMVCRNQERAEQAKKKIMDECECKNEKLFILLGDCSLQSGIEKVWKEFVEHRESLDKMRLDGILCNAGGLNNSSEAILTSEGIETTFAAHLLFGTYHLVKLALPLLEKTQSSRVIVVSSGGMYNTKFPSWNTATSRRGKFDGQLAYAFAKRGQVLLCEEWTKMFPSVKFASCHPGWVDTPGVDSAYGTNKSYLEPMRNLWEGSEGILWLLMTANENIEGGGFYLDRSPQVKHIAGPFFTEGCFTKNTPEEVSSIMSLLERWSTLPFNEGPLEVLLPNERVSRINFEASLTPLVAMDEQIDLHRYMGRWYVQANIPTSFDQDTINNIEEYVWDDDRKKVSVCFKYCNPLKHVKNGEEVVSPGPVKEILQIGTPLSDNGTEWALKVKLFFYIPVPSRYLIIGINEDVPGSNFHERTVAEGEYVSCMIGVADRSAIWIMNRDKTPMSQEALDAYVLKANLLGYDVSKIGRVPFIDRSEN